LALLLAVCRGWPQGQDVFTLCSRRLTPCARAQHLIGNAFEVISSSSKVHASCTHAATSSCACVLVLRQPVPQISGTHQCSAQASATCSRREAHGKRRHRRGRLWRRRSWLQGWPGAGRQGRRRRSRRGSVSRPVRGAQLPPACQSSPGWPARRLLEGALARGRRPMCCASATASACWERTCRRP